MKIKLNLFHFDKYALNLENWPVKYFGFQYILYTCNDNWFVIINRISWITIKESYYIHFVLINNWSVNYCNFIEKGISRSWKVGTVKEVMNSIFDYWAVATKRINSV